MSLKSAAKQLNDAINEATGNLENAEKAVTHWTSELSRAMSAFDALKPHLTADDLDFGPSSAPAQKQKGKPGAKPAHAGNVTVPATDFAFWLSLITADKQKTPQILEAAVTKLNLTTPAQTEVLKPRMAGFLSKAVEQGKIKAEGQRFDRVYWAEK